MSYQTSVNPLFSIFFGIFLLLTACNTDVEEAPTDTSSDETFASECQTRSDCGIGEVCEQNRCVEPAGCVNNDDCPGSQVCRSDGCYAPRPDVAEEEPEDTDETENEEISETEVSETHVEGDCTGCYASDSRDKCFPGNASSACGVGGSICKECQGNKRCEKGQCVEPPECTPETCNGCCSNGTCVSGTSGDRCGTSGEQCQQCIHGARCEEGECVLPCNENTCPDGCCTDAGKCVEGVSSDTCGTNGVACTKCNSDETCVASTGKCVYQECKSRCSNGCCSGTTCLDGDSSSSCGFGGMQCVDCGPGMKCDSVSQLCEVRPDSTWDLEVLSTKIPRKNGYDGNWDLWGLPDPYVKVVASANARSYEGLTSVIDNQLDPRWNEMVLDNALGSILTTNDAVRIQVYDDDTSPNEDDLIGECQTEFDSWDFDGTVFSVSCNPDSNDTEQVPLDVQFKLYH